MSESTLDLVSQLEIELAAKLETKAETDPLVIALRDSIEKAKRRAAMAPPPRPPAPVLSGRPSPPAIGAHPACSKVEAIIVGAIRGRLKGNGITSTELAAMCHRDPHAVRAIIAHLRTVHELPIAGTAAESYYYPRCPEDLDATVRSMRSRKIELDAAIDGILAGAGREFGTLPLQFEAVK